MIEDAPEGVEEPLLLPPKMPPKEPELLEEVEELLGFVERVAMPSESDLLLAALAVTTPVTACEPEAETGAPPDGS